MDRTAELAELIAGMTDRDGAYQTAIPGFYLARMSTHCAPRNSFKQAVFCVVAQGAKSVLLDRKQYLYDRSKYLMVSLDLPLVGQVVEASRKTPFLGISMNLDFAEISVLMLEIGATMPESERVPSPRERSLFVNPMDEDLLDAVIRLVCLLKKPRQIPILAPMVRREIFYKLLLSEQSGVLRRMAVANSQVQRIASGVEWLKRNLARPIRMDELAREVNMSSSSMHTWFKAVTMLSPLQYQKQLRLQEARRILLSEATDATTASRRVGYESPSQFSREYRRLFGYPPLRDIERLRSWPEGMHATPRPALNLQVQAESRDDSKESAG